MDLITLALFCGYITSVIWSLNLLPLKKPACLFLSLAAACILICCIPAAAGVRDFFSSSPGQIWEMRPEWLRSIDAGLMSAPFTWSASRSLITYMMLIQTFAFKPGDGTLPIIILAVKAAAALGMIAVALTRAIVLSETDMQIGAAILLHIKPVLIAIICIWQDLVYTETPALDKLVRSSEYIYCLPSRPRGEGRRI